MHRLRVACVFCVLVASAYVTRAESPSYLVFVSNERSGDVTVIDGNTDAVVVLFRGQTAARHSRDAGRETVVRYIKRITANGAGRG